MAVDYSTAIANLTAELNAATANPSPNYSINGQSVSFADYIAMLVAQLEKLEKLQVGQRGPWAVVKRAILR